MAHGIYFYERTSQVSLVKDENLYLCVSSPQVLSGDSLVIRGQPRNGPPPEKSLGLSNIVAPKLGRRGKDGIEVKDTVRLLFFVCLFVLF